MPSYKTYVSNGSSKAVWAKVDSDKTALKSVEVQFKTPGGTTTTIKTTYTTDFCGRNGFTKIHSGYSTAFDYNVGGSDDSVYVTIITEDGAFVCGAHSVQANRSVIVDGDCQLRRALYKKTFEFGDSKLWVDEFENDHSI